MFIIASIIVIITFGAVQLMPLATTPSPEILGVVEQGEENAVTATSTTDISIEAPVNENAYRSLLPQAANRDLSPVLRAEGAAAPAVTATAAVVFDVASKKVLYEKNPEEMATIASITKLMTALVVMDRQPDFTTEYVMQAGDRREGGRIYLYNGDRVTVNDLFNAMLVGSDNTAVIALIHALGLTEEQFVRAMNEKAYSLGLRTTTFADPIGLDPENRSTAFEVIELTRTALDDPVIRRTVLKDNYALTTKQGSTRVIASTDQLLGTDADFAIAGGKTGYLDEAGYCFTGGFSDAAGARTVITVVLGSATADTRFSETAALVEWTYDNYVWPQ